MIASTDRSKGPDMSPASDRKWLVVLVKCCGWLLFAIGLFLLGIGWVYGGALVEGPPLPRPEENQQRMIATAIISLGGSLGIVGPTLAYLAEKFWSGEKEEP